jgi:tRNA-2-methylthio-N6-dimethylallyladenosine synthase
MNKSDSERIESVLESSGFKKSSLQKADYAFLNLCSVKQSAIDRVWGKINQLKKQNNKVKIVLTGCILPKEKDKLQKEADYLFDINKLMQWPILNNKKGKGYLCAEPKLNSQFEAYVPIMTGCNNFCSYCAVPYTRGREKSRPTKDILNEVNKLIVQGYKFITLLGQNVNSYNGEINFPKLLKKIDKIPGNYWLSFLTSHPKDMSDELIKCFKTCKHLIPYFHLPIQVGSNKILTAMNRKYTNKYYLKLIDKIKKTNPDINLSTDIIVGFPGETKKDFNETVKIMKKNKYDMAYISQYSSRPNTAAEKLDDNISKKEKKERAKILTEVLKKTALEKNKKMVNKTTQVLIENKKDKYYLGKTRNFKNVKIKTNKQNLIGKFINIKINKATEWNLEGKII